MTDRNEKKPLICPKGYGICWTCETWCDMPSAARAYYERLASRAEESSELERIRQEYETRRRIL